MKAIELQEIIGFDHVSKSKGLFTIRKSFFYRHGYNSEKMVAKVKGRLDNAKIKYNIVDHYEHWAPFRGSDSIAKGSHFAVVVELFV